MSDKSEDDKDESVSKQVTDYYKKYSQTKHLPKYFSGSPLSYMLPIVKDDELVEAPASKPAENVPIIEPEPKAESPTSSVTSNRKLEWDNGADIGYYNCEKLPKLFKSSSLPILLKSQEKPSLSTRIVAMISYPASSSTSSKETPISSSSTSKLTKSSSYTSSISYLKSKIGSPDAESTPKLSTKSEEMPFAKTVKLCITKPISVQCIPSEKKGSDKKIQTSFESRAKSIQTTSSLENVPIISKANNQSVINVNYDESYSSNTQTDCNSFEYYRENDLVSKESDLPVLGQLITEQQSKDVICDVNKSIDLLLKLLKSKKYDVATKKRYVKKIVDKIVGGTYTGDSTSSSELFVPRKLDNGQPQLTKFTVKTFKDEFVPSLKSSEKGQGDQLLKFAKKERQHQLDWINDEICHLTKLRGLLQKKVQTTTVYTVSDKCTCKNSCSCSSTESNRRNYVIQTDLSSSSSSSSNVPAQFNLYQNSGRKTYELQEVEPAPPVNLHRKVVGDIQVVSDDQTTKINIKATKCFTRPEAFQPKEPILVGEGKYGTFPKSRTEEKCLPCGRPKPAFAPIGPAKFSLEVPLNSQTNISDKVREIIKKYTTRPEQSTSSAIKPSACKCLPHELHKPTKNAEIDARFKCENMKCQTSHFDLYNKQIQTRPYLKEQSTNILECACSSKQIQTQEYIRSKGTCFECDCDNKQIQTNLLNKDVKTGIYASESLPKEIQASQRKEDTATEIINEKATKQMQAKVEHRHDSTTPVSVDSTSRLIQTQAQRRNESTRVDKVDRQNEATLAHDEVSRFVQTGKVFRDQASEKQALDWRHIGTSCCHCAYRPTDKSTNVEQLPRSSKHSQQVADEGYRPSTDKSTKRGSVQSDVEQLLGTHTYQQMHDEVPRSSNLQDVEPIPELFDFTEVTSTDKSTRNVDALRRGSSQSHIEKLVGTYRDQAPTEHPLTYQQMHQVPKSSKHSQVELETPQLFGSTEDNRQIPSARNVDALRKGSGQSDMEKLLETYQQSPVPGTSSQVEVETRQMFESTENGAKHLETLESFPEDLRSKPTTWKDLRNGEQSTRNPENQQKRDQETQNELQTTDKQIQTSSLNGSTKSTKSSTGSSQSSTLYTSATSSSSSSYSESIQSCVCCKRKNVTAKHLYALRDKLSNQAQPFCKPCYTQNKHNNYTSNYYTDPGHVCNCYTVVQTKTLDEIKRTIKDLHELDEYCSCTGIDSGRSNNYCKHCKCKLKKTSRNRHGIAYTLTLEEASPQPEKKKKHRKASLEEIKIKVPVYKKRFKDKENKRKKAKLEDSEESIGRKESNTVQEYLQKNRPEFVEGAEGRRKSVNESKKHREETAEYNKLMFLKRCEEECEQTAKRLFSSKEIKEITKRNYRKLPEVQQKLNSHRDKQLRQASRLMADTFNRKLRENVLKGKRDLPMEVKIVNM